MKYFVTNFVLLGVLLVVRCELAINKYKQSNGLPNNDETVYVFEEDEYNGLTFPVEPGKSQDTLILLNVLVRHGNRTANYYTELYPNDPYLDETYFPYGFGQLTNAGKKKVFSVGTSLRNMYNDFLGDYYYPEIVESRSTDFNRTKMTLLLVLAGLFPPRKEDMLEDNIYWQPIPYNYVPKSQDKLLIGAHCPRYKELYKTLCASPEIQSKFKEYQKYFDYISRNSGLNITKFKDIYSLYFGLSTEKEYGLRLPMWTFPVWPDIITNIATREYHLSMATLDMRRLTAGHLLKKIVGDIKEKITDEDPLGKKIYLYSAHENNIAELLIALRIFKPHIPNYGAYVIIEVHKLYNEYKIKILYENYNGYGPEVFKMPDCDVYCSLDKFVSLVEHYFPSDNLCGN